MVKAYGKVPALAIVAMALGLIGCRGEPASFGGEEEGLVEVAEARPSAKPSSPELAPARQGSAALSPLEDRVVLEERTVPPPTVTPPAPAAPERPRLERRPPVPVPPVGGWPYPVDPELQAQAQAPDTGIVVPAGTRIGLRAETRLSSLHAWVGDRFQARVAEDVLAPDGMVLVPMGAVVEGVVTRVEASRNGEGDPGLELEPRALVMDGRVLDLDARMGEVELNVRGVPDGREMAEKAVAGATAGAILGKILGKDARSTIAGAVAGAAAGAAVGAAGGEAEAVLEEGAPLEIVLRGHLKL